jgi:hypothetical protein
MPAIETEFTMCRMVPSGSTMAFMAKSLVFTLLGWMLAM